MVTVVGVSNTEIIPSDLDIPPPSRLSTSLYSFDRMTEGATPAVRAVLTKNLSQFAHIETEAINEAAKMLGHLIGKKEGKASEAFQKVFEFLGQKRGEAKKACGEAYDGECEGRRVDDHLYALEGSEECYSSLIDKVAKVI